MSFIIKMPTEVRGNGLHLLARLSTQAYQTRESECTACTMDTNVRAGHFDPILEHMTSTTSAVEEQCWRMLQCWQTQLMMMSGVYL